MSVESRFNIVLPGKVLLVLENSLKAKCSMSEYQTLRKYVMVFETVLSGNPNKYICRFGQLRKGTSQINHVAG